MQSVDGDATFPRVALRGGLELSPALRLLDCESGLTHNCDPTDPRSDH